MNKLLLLLFGFLAFTISASGVDTYTQNVLLNLHNIERSCLGLRNLTWDATIAVTAQDWAEYLAKNDLFKHSGEDVGENIASASPRNNLVAFMFSLWAAEKEHFSNAKPYPDVSIDGHVDGHYTQVIWGATTSVGCGVANTTSMSYLVCQYLPAGNYKGNYVYTASDIVKTPNCNPGASQTTTKTPTTSSPSSSLSSSTKTTTTTKVTTSSTSPGHSTTYTNTTVTITPGHSTTSTNTSTTTNPLQNTTVTAVPQNRTNTTTAASSTTCNNSSASNSCTDPIIPTNSTSNSTQPAYTSKPSRSNKPARGKGKKKKVLKIVVDMTQEFDDVEILLRI